MHPYPLSFHPVLKQTIWGGRRLGEVLRKPIGDADNYAESWEIVDHGDDQSVVAGGALAGKSLADLIRWDRSWLMGNNSKADEHFPLLLKYLDCNRVLSVQVHPDDQYGAAMTIPDRGKTEAWYIVEADPQSVIFAGLKTGVDQQDLADAISCGQTESVLHSFEPKAGDCVFIPAGTVHALGAGLLVAEIQQSSDTTFRLFDWNRLGDDGQPRPLHIQPSLEVTDYQSGPVTASRSDPQIAGWQPLVQCDKFQMCSLEQGDAVIGGDNQFHIMTVPRGQAMLQFDNQTLTLGAGDSILLPAAMPQIAVSVKAGTLLEMRASSLTN